MSSSAVSWLMLRTFCLLLPVFALQAKAAPEITQREAGTGLKLALNHSVERAVAQLAKPDGFLANAKVRIPLPPALQKIERVTRRMGLSGAADELKLAMNRAAEMAVIEATPLLLDAVKKMSVADALGIVTGPDDGATRYLRTHASASLTRAFLPLVGKVTARVHLADAYNDYAGKAAQFGLIRKEDANLDRYVTSKTLDGLFVVMAEQEALIRKNPAASGSRLLRKIFGMKQSTAE